MKCVGQQFIHSAAQFLPSIVDVVCMAYCDIGVYYGLQGYWNICCCHSVSFTCLILMDAPMSTTESRCWNDGRHDFLIIMGRILIIIPVNVLSCIKETWAERSLWHREGLSITAEANVVDFLGKIGMNQSIIRQNVIICYLQVMNQAHKNVCMILVSTLTCLVLSKVFGSCLLYWLIICFLQGISICSTWQEYHTIQLSCFLLPTGKHPLHQIGETNTLPAANWHRMLAATSNCTPSSASISNFHSILDRGCNKLLHNNER